MSFPGAPPATPLTNQNTDSIFRILVTEALVEMSRKDMERKQRRQILMDAAEKVFGRKPFDEATMQEVAAEAQIGMQGLYEHFPSKQDLYEQIILQRAEELSGRGDEALDSSTDAMEALHRLARAYADLFRERPMFLPMFAMEKIRYDWNIESRFTARIHEVYERERGRVADLIARLRDAGKLRQLPVEFMTHLCMDALNASLWYHHRYETDEEVDTCVERAMRCFLAGAGTGG